MSNVGRAFAMAAERRNKDSGKWWQKALVYAAAPQIVGLGVEAVKEGGKALFLGQNSKDLFQTARGQDLLNDINAINNLKNTRANQEKAMTRDGGTISDWAYNDQVKKLRESINQRPELVGATEIEKEEIYFDMLRRNEKSFRETANKFQTDWYADTDKYQNIPTRKEALAKIESGTGFYSKSGIGRFGTMLRHRFDKKDIELEKNLSLMEAFYGSDYKNHTVEEFKKTLEGYDEDINELRTGYYGSYNTSTQGMNRLIDKAANDSSNLTYTEVKANAQKTQLVKKQVRHYISDIKNQNTSKALEAYVSANSSKLPDLIANMTTIEEVKSGQININDKITTLYADQVLGPLAGEITKRGFSLYTTNARSANSLDHLDNVLFQTFGGDNEDMTELGNKAFDKEDADAKARIDTIKETKKDLINSYANDFASQFNEAIYETKLSDEVSQLTPAGTARLFQEYMEFRVNNTRQSISRQKERIVSSYDDGLDFLINRLGAPNAAKYFNSSATPVDNRNGRLLADANNNKTTTTDLEQDAYGKQFNPDKIYGIMKKRINDLNITNPIEIEATIKNEITNVLEIELDKAEQLGYGKMSEDSLHGDVKNGLNLIEATLRKDYRLPAIDREDTVIGGYEEELGILLNPYKTVQKAVRERDTETLARFLTSNDAQLAAFTRTEMQNLGLNPRNFRE